SEIMKQRGIKSMKELIGIILPNPIIDFMELSPVKKISSVNQDLCEHCGNCARCPYLAITLDENKIPKTDPSKCIGCGICALKCFAKALSLRKRTKEELAMLKED
ncbi:MAG TPA: 4Fe-4S binding protein, partial [bacterium]|nr:4Fe-4S binding protein [bacterium]